MVSARTATVNHGGVETICELSGFSLNEMLGLHGLSMPVKFPLLDVGNDVPSISIVFLLFPCQIYGIFGFLDWHWVGNWESFDLLHGIVVILFFLFWFPWFCAFLSPEIPTTLCSIFPPPVPHPIHHTPYTHFNIFLYQYSSHLVRAF